MNVHLSNWIMGRLVFWSYVPGEIIKEFGTRLQDALGKLTFPDTFLVIDVLNNLIRDVESEEDYCSLCNQSLIPREELEEEIKKLTS